MMDPEPQAQPTSVNRRDFSRTVKDARNRIDSVPKDGDGLARGADGLAKGDGVAKGSDGRAKGGDSLADISPSADRQVALLEVLEELRTADEQLRQQNEELALSRDQIDRERQKFYELFDFAPDAYVVTDPHATIREANAAASQLLGVPRQFLIGKPIPLFFDEGARASHRHQLDQLCGISRIDDWEITLRPRNGAAVPASISIGRIGGKDKSITGFRWIIRDITKQKRAEEEARQLNRELELRVASRTTQLAAANRIKDELLVSERKAREQAEISNRVKSDFLALLSHEFRTPLQAIFGYTELLEREIHGPLNELQQRDLKRIQSSQQHLLGLINTILEFAKLESGQPLDIACLPTVMNETLGSVEALVGPHLEAKDLKYEYKCAGPAVVAQADPAKVQQVVLNLLANAIKFTDPGGSIRVECELESDEVAVHVSDTGRGIPADKLDAVFEPFVQLKTGGGTLNGTGLGLPISRRLATAMGGSLSVKSEVGKGSVFTLRLPRADRPSRSG
jgi:PAS domain S-box-containing protein